MGHYGGLTVKRHVIYGNCATVRCLDLGVMAKEYKQKHFSHGLKSANTYINRNGKKVYQGSKYLKGTQLLSLLFRTLVYFSYKRLS